MKYYSTQRPVMPGSYPKPGVTHIGNYGEKTYVPEIGRRAWGEVEYCRRLSEKEVSDYELVPEGTKTWYGVTTCTYADGQVLSEITDVKEAETKPEEYCGNTDDMEMRVLWFDSPEAANGYIGKTDGKQKGHL